MQADAVPSTEPLLHSTNSDVKGIRVATSGSPLARHVRRAQAEALVAGIDEKYSPERSRIEEVRKEALDLFKDAALPVTRESLDSKKARKYRSILELFDRKAFTGTLRKYFKVLSKDSHMLQNKNVFLAKFKVDACDDISVALLCASEGPAAALILGSRAIPLIVLSLIGLIVAGTGTPYPGVQYFTETATFVDIIIGLLALGLFVSAQLIGPLTRPFYILREFNIMRQKATHVQCRLLIAELCLSLKYFSTCAVVLVSAVVAVLNSTNIISMLWTALALSWLLMIDHLLVVEIIHRFYNNSSLTVAVSEMEWRDIDTRMEFWRRSWTSKQEIRSGLCNLDTPTHLKWQLLANKMKGLGLGTTSKSAPRRVNMEIMLIKWSVFDENAIANLGIIAAQAIQESEWIYDMSREQRRLIFKYFPIKASEMRWGGSVTLGVPGTGFEVSHVTAAVRIIENDKNQIDELYLHLNNIDDEMASVLSRALRRNKTITRLWLFYNRISDLGGIHLARMLTDNESIRSLHLRGNMMSDAAAFEFAAALQTNNTLIVLGLDKNRIGSHGACRLLEALQTNTTLERLWLMENDFDENDIREHMDGDEDLEDRVQLSGDGALPPVLKTLVRTQLDKMQLTRQKRSIARQLLRTWDRAARFSPEMLHRLDSMGSGLDLEIGTGSDVQHVVAWILKEMPELWERCVNRLSLQWLI